LQFGVDHAFMLPAHGETPTKKPGFPGSLVGDGGLEPPTSRLSRLNMRFAHFCIIELRKIGLYPMPLPHCSASSALFYWHILVDPSSP